MRKLILAAALAFGAAGAGYAHTHTGNGAGIDNHNALPDDAYALAPREQPRHEVGVNSGFCTGLGFAYRHWFGRWGAQAVGIPYRSDGDTFISLGLTGLYSLKETARTRVFLYWGNHFIYNKFHYNDFEPVGDHYVEVEKTRVERNLNSAVGLGFSLGATVGFNAMFGYAVYDIFLGRDILPSAEMGLFWRF